MMEINVKQIKQRFGIVGNSPLLDHAVSVAVQVAPTDMSVLIIGESGVGKEIFPRLIHQHSLRKHGPYIAVNCGAIPEGTIDSELFGHFKGSFTTALNDRKGYFQEANEGTIFLDEVGELPLSTQARLLRVLETGEFMPVGSSVPIKTDVRVVAATNVDMLEAVRRGRFREDLFFRLNVIPIDLPPLRKRREDVGLLFRYFAAQTADRYGMPSLRLDPEAMKMLEHYHWPGNIRELRNLAERISALERQRTVTAETLGQYLPQAVGVDYRPALRMQAQEREAGHDTSSDQAFMYMLMEMRKELSELRGLVSGMMQTRMQTPYTETPTAESLRSGAHYAVASPSEEHKSRPALTPLHSHPAEPHSLAEDVEVQEIKGESEPETRSLEEVEREMIAAALARHGGRRRPTAQELKISERTLYRKIKEYDLED